MMLADDILYGTLFNRLSYMVVFAIVKGRIFITGWLQTANISNYF